MRPIADLPQKIRSYVAKEKIRCSSLRILPPRQLSSQHLLAAQHLWRRPQLESSKTVVVSCEEQQVSDGEQMDRRPNRFTCNVSPIATFELPHGVLQLQLHPDLRILPESSKTSIMSSQPPTKKTQRISHNDSAPVSSGCSNNAHLSPELIARIATYADMSNSGVMNICLAVGPIAARPIRISYLKKNVKYLNRILKQLFRVRRNEEDRADRRDKAGANHREWMEVNADWKTIAITDEEMKMAQNVNVAAAIRSGNHPFVAFNNAAFAVELGLTDVVKFLIEGKGLNPNSYGWTLYGGLDNRLHCGGPRSRHHLVAIAMYNDRCDIFRFLVSLASMRLWNRETDGDEDNDTLFDLAVNMFCWEGQSNSRKFVKGFLAHPDFEINFQPYFPTFGEGNVEHGLPCLHSCLISLIYCLKTSTRNENLSEEDASRSDRYFELIKLLLGAGANVSRSYTDVGTAIDYFRRVMHSGHWRNSRNSTRPWISPMVKKALQMMERSEQEGKQIEL